MDWFYFKTSQRMVNDIGLIIEGLLIFLRIYYYVVFARVILDWFMVSTGTRRGVIFSIYQVLHALTEPVLTPIRRIIPSIRLGTGHLDLSPLVLLMLVYLVERLVIFYLV